MLPTPVGFLGHCSTNSYLEEPGQLISRRVGIFRDSRLVQGSKKRDRRLIHYERGTYTFEVWTKGSNCLMISFGRKQHGFTHKQTNDRAVPPYRHTCFTPQGLSS